jgi:hypothetical protein
MAKRYDVLGMNSYVTADGEEKTFFFKVGTMFSNKDGKDQFMLDMMAFPVPNKEGKVKLLVKPPEPRDNEYRGTQRGQQTTSVAIDDDIPF